MKKILNKAKIKYYTRKALSYFGAINLGIMIAAMIVYGFCFDTIFGMILAVLLMILPSIDNTYEEDIEEI